MSESALPPLLSGRDLTKIYPGVVANEGVDLDLRAGSIHAIIGENGAGKSTLVSMLYGTSRPDRGELRWQGEVLEAGQSQRFRSLGIGFVPQHVTLVEPFTAWENLVLNNSRHGWRNPAAAKELRSSAESLVANYQLELDLDQPVHELALGKRQNLELLKALLTEPKVLILDEPTAILTPQEVDRLFELLKQLKAQGVAVAVIAHKLAEVLALSDEITVLRKGKKVAYRKRTETDANELAALMIGSASETASKTGRISIQITNTKPLRPAVWLEDVNWTPPITSPRPKLENVSFKLFPGEILGVAGIDGNGQQELFELLTGDAAPTSGMLEILERDDLPKLTLSQRNEIGLRRVSEDRHHDGLALDLPIQDNLILQYAERPPFSQKGWLRKRRWQATGEALRKRFSIATATLSQPARSLSGGNQQKVVLARELRDPAKFLVVSQPTRGLDFKAAAFVESQLKTAAERGAAVVIISGDLDELLSLSHHIGVLHRGKWMGVVENEANPRERIGKLMAGQSLTEESA